MRTGARAGVRRALLRGAGDDAGLTLIDVMVAMTLMSIVMAIVTTGFVDMYRTANHTDAAALAQTRVLASFNKVEREVRYAQRIWPERRLDDLDYVVEYLLADSTGVQQCVQLLVPPGVGTLQHWQWVASASPTTAVPTTIATEVQGKSVVVDDPPARVAPFVVRSAGALGSNFDRLEVHLTTSVGLGKTSAKRDLDLHYTAQNTVSATADIPTCRRDP
jgi:type II secretory pathway pseudopilin PulG